MKTCTDNQPIEWEKENVVFINIWQLQEEILHRIEKIASFEKMDEETFRFQKEAALVCMRNIKGTCRYPCNVTVLLQPFAAECVGDGFFVFGKEKISCAVLDKIDRQKITQGYLYAFHAPQLSMEKADSILEQYYMQTFQVACMDVLRDWLRDRLERKHSRQDRQFCSPSFGPGYYGMGMEAAEKLIGLMDAERAGITWENGCMQPMMSLVGIYLVSGQELLPVCKDCENCGGNRGGCEFCR